MHILDIIEGLVIGKAPFQLQHIMQVNSVRRRNILHEMASTLTVNVYLRSDEENHLRLNLKAPVSEVMAASHASEEELVSLIMRLSLH